VKPKSAAVALRCIAIGFRERRTDRGVKFLGCPLKQIRTLAREGDEARRGAAAAAESAGGNAREIDQAIAAISNAPPSFRRRANRMESVFDTFIRRLKCETNMDWSKKSYSPEAQAKVTSGQNFGAGMQERVSRAWAALLRNRRMLSEDLQA